MCAKAVVGLTSGLDGPKRVIVASLAIAWGNRRGVSGVRVPSPRGRAAGPGRGGAGAVTLQQRSEHRRLTVGRSGARRHRTPRQKLWSGGWGDFVSAGLRPRDSLDNAIKTPTPAYAMPSEVGAGPRRDSRALKVRPHGVGELGPDLKGVQRMDGGF
jgi:hypothetical protein